MQLALENFAKYFELSRRIISESLISAPINKRVLIAISIVALGIIASFVLGKKYFSSQTKITLLPNVVSFSRNSSSPAIDYPTSGFVPPLSDAAQRITKKPFGIYITPATSPVQPERFKGYHTGADFEIFPSELNITVPVDAVCNGKLLLKEWASGYGGVAVESCMLNNQPITVIYGHLNIASVKPSAGEQMKVGEVFADLGANKSPATDGERKHLHLGFHKGTAINILGYVPNKSQLNNWINPCLYVCK